MVVQQLSLLHHGKKGPGPVLFGFLPQSKNVHLKISKLVNLDRH